MISIIKPERKRYHRANAIFVIPHHKQPKTLNIATFNLIFFCFKMSLSMPALYSYPLWSIGGDSSLGTRKVFPLPLLRVGKG